MDVVAQEVVTDAVISEPVKAGSAAPNPSTLELIEQTWKEVGYRIRPLRRTVFVRTLPLEEKVGSLYLPTKLTKFYGELPHQKTIRSIVLATGPKAKVQPGSKVCFTRLYFAWWKKLEDGCMVGWIDENQLTGYFEEE